MERSVFTPLALFITVMLTVLAYAPARAEESVTFTFQPPAGGVTFIETQTDTETETYSTGGEAETQVSVTTTRTRIRVDKTETGYNWTETEIGYEVKIDGEAQEPDPFDKAMLDAPITVELDKNGQWVALKGIDEMLKKARAEMDEESLALFDKVMSRAKVERMIKEEWLMEVKPFLGLTKKPGESWNVKGNQYVFSSNLLPVTAKLTMQKLATAANRPCAVVETTWSPDLKDAAKDLRLSFEESGMFPKEANPKFTVLSYTSQSVQYLDPSLLMALKENAVQNYRFKVTVGDQTIEYQNKKESVTTVETERKWTCAPADTLIR